MDVRAPTDVTLAPLEGEPRSLDAWLTTFNLVVVVLDPYTYESSWLLQTARRILREFEGADCRVAWLVCAGPDDAEQFLGPLAQESLTFADPDRTLARALGLERLPAFVHIDQGGNVVGAAEGWDPDEWRTVAEQLADAMSWSRPQIPTADDPVPYEGSPAIP